RRRGCRARPPLRQVVPFLVQLFNDLKGRVMDMWEAEWPGGRRPAARLPPLGDIHLVVGEHVADGATQQRRIVACHRRHDQELRVLASPCKREVPLETNEVAERLGDDPARPYCDVAAVDGGGADVPDGFAIAARGALK